ncbi:MAG: Sulfur carrier protein CysO [bacterium]|nr:Sulfur carrier protein CysO [bacterium]
MRVCLSSHLRDYTAQRAEVEATGETLGAVLADLDRQYPGLRFRIVDERQQVRPHINIYLRGSRVRDLQAPVGSDDEIHLLAALSGG